MELSMGDGHCEYVYVYVSKCTQRVAAAAAAAAAVFFILCRMAIQYLLLVH